MITVSNTFIPTLKRRRAAKEPKPIAKTEAGDVAFYNTASTAVKKKMSTPAYDFDADYSDDDDDDDDVPEIGGDDKSGLFHTKPLKSLTGADWQPCFNDRMTMFIAGTPGAGKSYLAKQMINLLPSSYDILLFTALEEKDGNFDDLGKERLYKIKMTPEVLSTITLAEIRKRAKSP